LGHIFAAGNLAKAYGAFMTDHVCNNFCKFFRLEPFVSGAPLFKTVEDGEIICD
jgi:hypothetical protein